MTGFPDKKVMAELTANMLLEVDAVRFMTDKPFIYTSGWASPVYTDCRRLISFPRVRSTLVDFGGGEVGHQRLDVVDAVIDDADRARGEAAIAAGLILRRRLAHHDLGALLLRSERRTERRIAGADHNHIRNLIGHFRPFRFTPLPRRRHHGLSTSRRDLS